MALAGSLVLTSVAVPASVAAAAPAQSRSHAGSQDAALAFDPSRYTTITVTVDGRPLQVRWYKEICYVANPVAAAAQQPGGPGGGTTTTISNTACGYQSMNVFVSESAFGDQRAPIYFAVNNSGWMASYIRASVTAGAAYNSATSNVGAALKAGYVFVDVASRSRGLIGADGSFPGKAPAAVTDAKAAVRYLRLNDIAMPGSAERIVVNGTSGGGALASALGASGNSAEYTPYLAAVGAAGIDAKGRSTLRDDVFAVNAYCPITDLGNADIAYEWLYNALGTRDITGQNLSPAAATETAARFAAYEKSLGLRNPDGSRLTAATMLDTIQQEVVRSAETYLKEDPAHTIPPLGGTFQITAGGTTKSYVNDWIDVDTATRTVRSVDMTKYLAFVATQAALKTTPAFDAVGVAGNTTSRTETNLFGPPTQMYLNYTEYSWNHNDVPGDGSGLDDTGLTWKQYTALPSTTVDDQIHLINPMDFIGTKADTAPNWYVRHGTRDRDTAFTVSVNLDRALAADKQVEELDYRLAWNQPHAGNYDVPEAMAWIARIVQKAGDPLA
ncbi:alpha/beta hydrolase fold domain-containing protein [Streptomyces sp. TRM S81-3]|uniref:Alpha/beta hydrolase fold domain-containing protein n=1 Tax=Streptomyces griseicoloratus TaxID=2752516 RepID=A0A926LAJ9_9ACTN|nr:subtype B tannase [Streptomyces griseicoloratus]MBD0424054.1 alpha/beta hydrolase fold domain-containing protein [Streptomyces griseicoloratus]